MQYKNQWGGGIILSLCIVSSQSKSAQKSGFELYGDVMQILPLAMMAYSYGSDDTQGVKEQALGTGAILGFSTSYLIASTHSNPTQHIHFTLNTTIDNTSSYHIHYKRIF
ncbi:hypothetical protein OQH61_08810 [Helicobacter sp. MIT 21-1697]|uniref:hypothetical protein n=1 Tax=Helicobacter sp. MIT 21-1697 TaxID=2993733 RepID=UPI00224ADD2A|nr:hypothetical protein [Helicobacter sp. MIT 21-1697]MCX2717831.1 hypothetical protein [Helicobacter sp. MIT 21-1697]